MPANRSVTRGHSQRPLLIVAILLTCLTLIAALGWQYWRLQQLHSAAAASALRDYEIQVADDFRRRLAKSVSYFGYTAIFKRCYWMASADELHASLSDNAAGLASSVFWHDGTGLSISRAEATADFAALIDNLRLKAIEHVDFTKPAHTDMTGRRVVYMVITNSDDSRGVCGFVLNRTGLASFAQMAIDDGPLLPRSAAGDVLGNDLIFIEVQDWRGESVFKANPHLETSSVVTKPLTEDSLGALAGFIVRVSLDPQTASVLVVGGLNDSRLPWLMAMLAMASLLLVGAIWLFRREQAVIEMREDFVSQVSHELRTPLTQIRMFAETLLLNRTRSDEERRRSLEIIDRESQRLSHLVGNVLRASSVSGPVQLDCRELRLAPILSEVCDTMQSTYDKVTIRLSADESVMLHADADAVREILINLLDNAVKYGPDGQTIKVILSNTEDSVRLIVEDEGPGIPEDEKERVWDKFYRLGRERKSAISGTGIGLAVVRELTTAMGGSCWIESINRGVRVTIEFPEDQECG